MSEPTVTQQPIVDPSAEALELETLRRVNGELVTKHAKSKARISELETGTVALQAQLSEASDSLYQATVGGPLKTMCESLSTVPDLFQEQFSKHFKVEIIKGSLTLLSADGKPIIGKDGKAIPFERQSLAELLTTGGDARARTFQAITIVNRASGAGASIGTNNRVIQAKAAKPQFGLR